MLHRKYLIANAKKLSETDIEREIDKAFAEAIKKKDTVVTKLDFKSLTKTAIFLTKELEKIITNIPPSIDESNYKDACISFIETMEKISYNIDSFTASISYFNELEEKIKELKEDLKKSRKLKLNPEIIKSKEKKLEVYELQTKLLVTIKEKWNKIIEVTSTINIERFKKLYSITLENEYLDKDNFKFCLTKINKTLNDLKSKITLLS